MNKLPRSLKDFIVYYYRIDPKKWTLFVCQDLVHFTRYAFAFLLVGQIVDILTGASVFDGVPSEAWMLAGCIFIVLGIGEASHIWSAYIIRKWKPRLRARIRRDFFEYALGHSHAYFQDHFAGSLARKVTEIAESSFRMHDHMRFSIGGALIAMGAASVALLNIAPIYGVGLLLFIASVTIPVFLRLKKISARSRQFSEVRASVTGTIVDILSNVTSMRNYARSAYERSMHQRDTEAEEKADARRLLTMHQIENYRRLSLVLVGGGMMMALLWGWQNGIVTVGEVSAAMGLTFSLVGSTWMFGFGVIMMADELGYIDDALRMITPAHGVQDKPDARKLVVRDATIRFENVGFDFPGHAVFDDLRLDIPAGQKIGLVGPSGAGKSTLMNILLRLYDVDRGRITVDGQDIRDVTQDSLRDSIAIIPQDTALFHRSLIDNIRYGRLDASDEEVRAAARLAHAHEFIESLPEGYATLVGERGIKLSGGQRQRIAIARAILKDAPILLLDEATSALDSESEQMIQDSLKTLMQGKTVIAIAHRLSTIATMDRLVVMDRGAIVEEGTHAELLAGKGLYARLWSMQSGGFLGDNDL